MSNLVFKPRRASVAGAVLVVDDDALNRQLLREILQSDGHTVYEAADGEEALQSLSCHPDVVLLDVVMPKMSGFEVCRSIKSQPERAAIPVLLVTSLGDRSDRLKGIAAGANDFLTKPIDTMEVILRVRNAVCLHRFYDQMSDLLGMATHDMRNPLSVIKTYSRLVLSCGEPLSPMLTKCMTAIDRSSTFLLRLVGDLLDVSKIESGRLTLNLVRCDLHDLLAEVVALNQVLADCKSIALQLKSDSRATICTVDEAKMEQVFNNLIANAIKFAPPRSTVEIELRPLDVDGVEIAVTDAGPGIPPHEVDRVFQPFGMASQRKIDGEPQTGLGLAIADKIVRGHGGSIRVENDPGRCCFKVLLPTRVEPARAEG